MIAAPPQSPAGKISVMVVEDQPQILKNQLKILKAFPEIDVIATALSGEAALELLEERQPDVILQDLGLPRMTGIEVTRAVKSRWPKVEVLIFTIFDEEERVVATGRVRLLCLDQDRPLAGEQVKVSLHPPVE